MLYFRIKKLRYYILFFAVLLLYSFQPKTTTIIGRIVAVKDGDTYELLTPQRTLIKVRLAHIDCPEKNQPYGKSAKHFAASICFGKTVTLISNNKQDRYQRYIGEIIVQQQSLNQLLVAKGYAWHFKKYSNDTLYHHLEEAARKKRIGLWADAHPIAPWLWRKGIRN